MQKISERISVFDIFKIGIGPSSSHTLGTWKAAQIFISSLKSDHLLHKAKKINIHLYGSLAKTGKGHGISMAIILGLSGHDPKIIDTHSLIPEVDKVRSSGKLYLGGKQEIDFNIKEDILFHTDECLPFHPNGMHFEVITDSGRRIIHTYYSIGGGFVATEDMPFPKSTVFEPGLGAKIGHAGRGGRP